MTGRRHPHARHLVVFQLLTSGALVLAALVVATAASAGPRLAGTASSTIGRTWPIAEPDAMAEIEAKARTLPPMANRFGPRSGWQALRAATLGRASSDRVRTVVPFHSLEQDIVLPDGRVLYPKGFTFNPLAFVSLPQRLVIVDRRDLAWGLATARPTDFLLVAGDDAAAAPRNDDIIALSDRAHRPLFLLEERIKQRLGLTVAPVIVRQRGQALELHEIRSAATASKAVR